MSENTNLQTQYQIILDGVAVQRREDDNYVNFTALCQAGKKLFKRWNDLDRTREFMTVLASRLGISVEDLIVTGMSFDTMDWENDLPFQRKLEC